MARRCAHAVKSVEMDKMQAAVMIIREKIPTLAQRKPGPTAFRTWLLTKEYIIQEFDDHFESSSKYELGNVMNHIQELYGDETTKLDGLAVLAALFDEGCITVPTTTPASPRTLVTA